MKFDLQTDLKPKTQNQERCECGIDNTVWKIITLGAILVAILVGLQ